MRVLRGILVSFLTLLLSCSGQSGSSEKPIRILYPRQGATIFNDYVSVVVKRSSDLSETEVFIDGKKPRKVNEETSGRVGFRVYSFRITPGRHRIEVSGIGQDIEKVKQAYKKFKGISDLENLERQLKKVPIKQYKDSIEITVEKPGPLRLKPINSLEYFSIQKDWADIQGIKPLASTEKTALIRMSRGLTDRFWVVPRDDPRRAEEILEGEPYLELTYPNRNVQPPMVQGCSGAQDQYVLVRDTEKQDKLAFYFLNEKGQKNILYIDYNDIRKKAFYERLVPPSWWKEASYIMKWHTASVLPDHFTRPLLCSDALVVMPVRFDCIYIKCSPSVVPGYLIAYRDGSFDLFISDKNRFEGATWVGSEVVVPSGRVAVVLDLGGLTYRVLGTEKVYKLPLLLRLPEKLSRMFYFRGHSLVPDSNSTMVSLQISEEDTNIYGLIEGVFANRVILKQTLMFVNRTGGRGYFEEVPLYYEIEGAD